LNLQIFEYAGVSAGDAKEILVKYCRERIYAQNIVEEGLRQFGYGYWRGGRDRLEWKVAEQHTSTNLTYAARLSVTGNAGRVWKKLRALGTLDLCRVVELAMPTFHYLEHAASSPGIAGRRE
jgi:hypothetical protein